MTEQSSPVRSVYADPTIRMSLLICVLGLGGFLAWAALAPLAEGVPASGQIVAEQDRQVVQHLEGGIIAELMVGDGDRVDIGAPLLALEETASLSARDEILQEIATLTGSLARLEALRDDRVEPDFAALALLDIPADAAMTVRERQLDLFHQQKQAFDAEQQVLRARRDGARRAQSLFQQQVVISERALAAARDQRDLLEQRVDRQMARLDELRAMERDVATLEGQIGNLQNEIEEDRTLELDLDGQLAQSEANFRRQLSAEQLDVRSRLEQAEERLATAQDVLNRSVIIAPYAGEVLNLRFATQGGVVRPGEVILEIIPDVREVTVSARIRPADRDAVFEGQAVRTQLSAYKSWRAPRLDGEVRGVSADLKTDPASGANYYEVRIVIPASEMDKLEELAVLPGMPVDVFIYSGTSRTTLDYLLEPIGESIFRGSRTG